MLIKVIIILLIIVIILNINIITRIVMVIIRSKLTPTVSGGDRENVTSALGSG